MTTQPSAAVPALVEFAVYASMAIAAALYYWLRAGYVYVDFSLRTLLVPAGLVLLASFGLGIGFLTATQAVAFLCLLTIGLQTQRVFLIRDFEIDFEPVGSSQAQA